MDKSSHPKGPIQSLSYEIQTLTVAFPCCVIPVMAPGLSSTHPAGAAASAVTALSTPRGISSGFPCLQPLCLSPGTESCSEARLSASISVSNVLHTPQNARAIFAGLGAEVFRGELNRVGQQRGQQAGSLHSAGGQEIRGWSENC